MNQKQTRTLVFTLLLFVLSATPALSQVIYDSTVNPQPGNLPSVGPEAYGFKELGDAVTFTGTARSPKNVTVTMSSWGCQSGFWFASNCVTTPGSTFSIPITLNIYNAGSPTPGSPIASVTQTFAIPYRPSSDNTNCPNYDGNHPGRWYQATTGSCFNGLANNITFDLTSLNILLPNSIVYGITYNTSNYGPSPIGTSAACYTGPGGCPYDSLNIALAPAVTTGSKPFPDTLYWNNVFASNYCDSGLAGTNTFRLDSPTSACWAGFVPAAQFTAYTIAATKDGCKNGGWQSLARVGGSTFKNQGDCQQYVNTGK